MTNYNHLEIEPKWMKKWSDDGLYRTPTLKPDSKKKYILETFPYPSGYAMHVGHIKGYVGSDVTARYARMRGYSVLYPIGWDAFGLPAENYAIKTGIHPRPNTDEVIKVSTDQLMQVGLSYDWDREIATHRPEYYRWTQWIFSLLYKRGLAYKKEALVNWDPVDQTVLANEQVLADGTAERSGAIVEQKYMSQWFFKITDYADRLLNDLDSLDWPESTKQMQRNWIGKSEGVEVVFKINDLLGENENITVFTTAVDTIFGVTFLVLAPEHPVVQKYRNQSENSIEIDQYLELAKLKTNLERESNKDKTGVKLSGIMALNPINGAEIPVYIADYVISTYGTGAIMAVPGEDQRDYEFAQKYNLPIIYTTQQQEFIPYSAIKKHPRDYFLANSGDFNGLNFDEGKEKIILSLEQNMIGKRVTNYKLRDWLVSRQRYWGSPIPIVYDRDGIESLVPESDLPVLLPDDVNFMPTGRSPLIDHIGFHDEAEVKYGDGVRREVDTMDTFCCSSWYFFRYCSPKNTDFLADAAEMKKWMPVDQYIIGAEHSTMHLLYARFFTKVLFDEGLIGFNEPFVVVRHQGLVRGEDGRKMSKRWGNVVNPNDIIADYGADTLRMYQMFMGPFEDGIAWSANTVKGVRRFLDRVWKMQDKIAVSSKNESKIEVILHRLIKKVGEDIETMSFNTSVSECMKFVNSADDFGGLSAHQFERFILILAPFAPYITEELWSAIGNKNSVHTQQYPVFNERLLVDEFVTIVVQINGKVRASFVIESDSADDVVIDTAKTVAEKWLTGNQISFTKYIPNRIVSFVIE